MGSYTLNTVITIMALTFSEARRNGSIPLSACEDMIPDHGIAPQSDPFSYRIHAMSYFFIPGKTINVILSRESTSPFKGFYCQAKKTYSNLTVGQFEDVDDMPNVRGHSCFSQSGVYDTVSHSLQWSENTTYLNTQISLKWKTSDDLLEAMGFRCTFVQSYKVFWINQESAVFSSMATYSPEECCGIEELSWGCLPLCRHVREEPADLELARYTLESVWNTNATCGFFQALVSIRCSYWTRYFSLNDSSEGSAEPFDNEDLEECCVARNISQQCMIFCDPDRYAEFTIVEEDFGHCLEENKELSLCIIYPTARDDNTSTRLAISPLDATESTIHSGTSSATSPLSTTENSRLTTTSFSGSGETTSFQQFEDGVVVYVITTTVNVDGALQDNSLQQSIFEGLKKDLLAPSLATLAGYINVQVGVEVYEGSLVVLSEGYFLQQANGSVPTLQNMENALQNRLGEIGGQISHSGAVWLLDQIITVLRKVVNGLCVDGTCESSQTCVEVGSNDTLCLCQGVNNEELICADENPIETTAVSTLTSSQETNADLPPGAIAGIAVGIVVLMIVVIGLSILAYRRTYFCCNSERSDYYSKKTGHTSETYVYHNDAVENNEEHVYSSIPYQTGNEPPALPPDNLHPTLPSNSVTYDRATSNQEETEQGHSEEQYTGYLEPSTLTGDPAGAPEINEEYTEPYTLSDSSETKQQDDQIVEEIGEDKQYAPVNVEKSLKSSSDYPSVDGYEVAIDELCTHENDSSATDIPLKSFKVSSSELQANGYITFDK